MSDAPGGITAATPEQTDRVTANELDGGKLDCTIRETFTRLDDAWNDLPILLQLAQDCALHTELGFASWPAYIADAVSEAMPNISRDPERRQKVVATMTSAGMSQRAIADAVGVSNYTVSTDQKAIRESETGVRSPNTCDVPGGPWVVFDAPQPAKPVRVTGLDGKTYARPVKPESSPSKTMLTLRTHTGAAVEYPKPQGRATFNETPGDGISWASWSWNPVTGCLHGCDYCYARDIATSQKMAAAYPVGFTPLFHHERLDAPANTKIPAKHADDPAYKRVFVCSMADLYGRWVPDEWINEVHASMLRSPQWQYILLTKFPARYVGLDLPDGAWVGTSVDEQKRVRIAQDAFAKLPQDKKIIKWLSLEPLREPLQFDDLSMFDWVVIGAQTRSVQPSGVVDAFAPPYDWFQRIYTQAREAGCSIHVKPNLIANPGMQWPREYPQ